MLRNMDYIQAQIELSIGKFRKTQNSSLDGEDLWLLSRSN